MKRFNRIIILLLAASHFSVPYAERLYVFYPTVVRPNFIQKKLSETYPGIEITVFGRYKDFKAQLENNQPDAILVKPELLQQLSDYKKVLSGMKDGKSDMPLMLLSMDKKIDIATIGNETIGAVDFLGRKGMESLVASIFDNPPKLKRVTKVEDLLPLLTFNMVVALLLCEDEIKGLKEKSKLNFVITEMPDVRIGIITCAVKKTKDSPLILRSIKESGKVIYDLFEIDELK